MLTTTAFAAHARTIEIVTTVFVVWTLPSPVLAPEGACHQVSTPDQTILDRSVLARYYPANGFTEFDR